MNSSMKQVTTAGSGSRFEHSGRSFRVCVESDDGGACVLVFALDNDGADLESAICNTSRSCTTAEADSNLASVILPMCAEIAADMTAANL